MKTRSSKSLSLPSRRNVLWCLGASTTAVAISYALPLSRAFAQDGPLDAPRDQGVVGEGADGFAILRDGAGADVQALVDQINAQRRDFYQSKADEQGVDISAIQEIYAAAIYDNAPVGWWFLIDGGWVQK